MAAVPLSVCIVGSGSWGSAIAKLVGENVRRTDKFAPTVRMWVFEETVAGRRLADVINTQHENVKYLPGHALPANVRAVASLPEAVRAAHLLVFAVPQQFLRGACDAMAGAVAAGALGLSLIKGLDEGAPGLRLVSEVIRERLGIEVSVLMGANLASEVAAGHFCEATLGSRDPGHGRLFQELLQTPDFRITVVPDAGTVELCGALKNVVALAAGLSDGLGCGHSTKAAVVRLGLMEMLALAALFRQGPAAPATFLESCGVGDLLASCYGGRNRSVAEAFARTGRALELLEQELLGGQKLQGPRTAAEVHRVLRQRGLAGQFPLFTAVYEVCFQGRAPSELLAGLRQHPQHKDKAPQQGGQPAPDSGTVAGLPPAPGVPAAVRFSLLCCRRLSQRP